MKNQSMFPYRRNGPKKRGKGGGGPGGGRRHHDGGGGRRIPGSAAELLPMLQPTTKALAQMLAGNTKSSGQLVHARNILAQANRLVEDRMVDRLPPAAREEFFDQLARLKLTVADADEAGLTPEPSADVQVKPVAAIGVDRLREVALRIAASSETPAAPPVPFPQARPELFEEPEPARAAAVPAAGNGAEAGTAEGPSTGTGPRRERLRLKSVRQATSDSDG
jgi:hypothetical protein